MAEKANGKAKEPAKNADAMTADQRLALHHHHVRKIAAAVAAKNRAVADLRNVRKVAKADLGDEGLAELDLALKIATPEGEAALRSEFDRIRRVAIWHGADIGTQLGLLDTLPAKDWRAEGKRAGLKGEALRAPDGLASQDVNTFAEGWREGQAVLAEGFAGKVGDTGERPANDDEDLRGAEQKRREEEAATGRPSTIGIGTEPSSAIVKQ